MKYYDGKKIKEYIRTHSDGLVVVEIGMGEDWGLTAYESNARPRVGAMWRIWHESMESSRSK